MKSSVADYQKKFGEFIVKYANKMIEDVKIKISVKFVLDIILTGLTIKGMIALGLQLIFLAIVGIASVFLFLLFCGRNIGNIKILFCGIR